MASAAEQLAANINFGAIAKADELKKRIWFTLGALIVYRLGTYIPLPGINPEALAQSFQNASGGVLGLFNMFSGGAVERMAIFALGIMPYISASIIIQLMTAVVPRLEQLKKEGEQGRKVINQYTRYLTVVLAVFQSWGIAVGLQNSGGIVQDPGPFFVISAVVTLTGGTMFLMWLGEQITSRGIGNGISLIIFAGIVASLPAALWQMFALARTGTLNPFALFMILAIAVTVVIFIVFMERAQRRILVQYPKRQQGNRMFGGESSFLPLKVNTAGVIPPIFASSLLLLPATIASFQSNQGGTGIVSMLTAYLAHGRPAYMFLYAALIVFFAFFYTALTFRPDDVADNIKKQGGYIPGIRPGRQTADFIEGVLNRITFGGALYLAAICVIPSIITGVLGVRFSFGGTALLIVVGVALDTVQQIEGHLISRNYEGFAGPRGPRIRGRVRVAA